MTGRVLVLNAGSSSLKAEVFAGFKDFVSLERVVVEEVGCEAATLRMGKSEPRPLGRLGGQRAAAERVLDELERAGALGESGAPLAATAHRLVHGGELFSAPTIVDSRVRESLQALAALAPLHNPPALAVLDAVLHRYPEVPAVAVFDTAFFRDLPEHARTYAIPAAWRESAAIRRYGFHGIAHEDMYRRYAAAGGRRREPRRVVTLQLGNGCSAAAILNGRPVETSMGFTPLEGLVMGSRGGDVDPGILLHLAQEGVDWPALALALNRESGLKALSERSSDMREILRLEAAGDAKAALAVNVFCHRARKYIGAYAAVLGGLDALLFGGGIGENAPAVRARICAGLEWLGVELDRNANADFNPPVSAIGAPDGKVDVYAIAVHEERQIARCAAEILGRGH